MIYPTTIIICILLIIVIYSFYFWSPVEKQMDAYIAERNDDTYDELITNLEDIPQIKIEDSGLEEFDCRQNPKFLGTENRDYTFQCYNICGGNGVVQQVHEGETIFINNKQLKPGYWCFAQKLIECNFRTGYIIATATGATCASKYPNLVGGPSATTISACSAPHYRSKGILLDRANGNKPFDPLSVNMTSEDEMINGLPRFHCRYPNVLERLIPHPLNPLVPVRDPCVDDYPKFNNYFDWNFDYCVCEGREPSRLAKCSRCNRDQNQCLRLNSKYSNEIQPCPDFLTDTVECTGVSNEKNKKDFESVKRFIESALSFIAAAMT